MFCIGQLSCLYVPLDPAYPPEYKKHIVVGTQLAVVVTASFVWEHETWLQVCVPSP